MGGRAGSASTHDPATIVSHEINTAWKLGKQVYIFVEKQVLTEYETWQLNKSVKKFKARFVDSLHVFDFIESLYAFGINNAIFPFDTAEEITTLLREQLAGLFQNLLQSRAEVPRVSAIEEIMDAAHTLRQVVAVISPAYVEHEKTLNRLRLMNHPVFRDVKKAIGAPYRVVFENLKELEALLSARGWKAVSLGDWDAPDMREWTKRFDKSSFDLLKVAVSLFNDEEELVVFSDEQWNEGLVTKERRHYDSTGGEYDPFAEE